MGKMIPPCGSFCRDRHPGCHGKCEKYLAYRAEIEAARPKNYAAADADDYTRLVRQKIALRRICHTPKRHGSQEN